MSPFVLHEEVSVRRGLLLIVAAAAVTSVLGGLARLGVVVGWGPSYAFEHGPMFVLGVFGTVIALERAVALGRSWSFAAPALGACAAIAMLAGLAWAPWAAALSALALIVVNLAVVQRQAAPYTWLMLVGSCVLAFGSGAWALGRPVFEVVFAWIAFFVLTIVAERLELSRLAPTPRWASHALVVLSGLLAALACACALGVPSTRRPFGAAMLLVAAWQLRYDLARRLVQARPRTGGREPGGGQSGLPRFVATGVLLGAAWLFATGLLLAWAELPPAGPRYDAVLHGVFVGYVLSMVFAHAPIILPAVARVDVPFTRLLYVPLALLHAGLAARVIGDLTEHELLRRAGGVASALALVLFAVSVVAARLLARERGRSASRGGVPPQRN